MIKIPTIDFSCYDENDDAAMAALADEVYQALSTAGFMKITNSGISPDEIDAAFELAHWFFRLPEPQKSRSAYGSASENFGYQSVGVETLDPTQPADLKQTFTMRDVPRHDAADPRWPSDNFRTGVTGFYESCLQAAYRIQRVFSIALDQPRDFFTQYYGGENVTLRFLYYPSQASNEVEKGQLGAGAHTDYGMITLLFQRDVSGLEVQDAAGRWHGVSPEADAIVINTGDLMERWTNGKFRSTPHRVQPRTDGQDRFSIAMFVDPDSATPVRVLDTCLAEGEAPRFPEVTAGEHIQQKISATQEPTD